MILKSTHRILQESFLLKFYILKENFGKHIKEFILSTVKIDLNISANIRKIVYM